MNCYLDDKDHDQIIDMKEESRRKRIKKKTASSLVTSCFEGNFVIKCTFYLFILSRLC